MGDSGLIILSACCTVLDHSFYMTVLFRPPIQFSKALFGAHNTLVRFMGDVKESLLL